MTGPEHFRMAEELMETITGWNADNTRVVAHVDGHDAAGVIAAAQVHATLALAAMSVYGPDRLL